MVDEFRSGLAPDALEAAIEEFKAENEIIGRVVVLVAKGKDGNDRFRCFTENLDHLTASAVLAGSIDALAQGLGS